MVLSELYTVDTSFTQGLGGGDCTYQWSNYGGSVPFDYIQYYAESGKETIDPTIFALRYPQNDPFVMGSAITQIEMGTAQEVGLYVAQNQFRKLVSNPAHSSGIDPFDSNSNTNKVRFTSMAKYDVDTASNYSIDGSQRFYVNFDYGRLLLIPKVAGWKYNDNQNVTPVGTGNLMYIDDFLQNVYTSGHQHYLITSATFVIKYANSFPSGDSFSPMYIQFKGTLKDYVYTRDSWGYSNISGGEETSGVFLAPCNNSLFSCPSFGNTGKPSYGSFMSPYDITQFCLIYTAPNTARYMGVTDVNIIYTLMDRLGFYWSKNPNSDCDELGVLCDDPDVRCPIIDIEHGNLVTDTVLTGTDIATYAQSNPESNTAWGYAGYDHDGITFETAREEYSQPSQPTIYEEDEISLNAPVQATSGGNTIWIMSEAKVKEFFTWIWNPDGTIFDDIVKGCALLGENPMNSVVSLKLFPFDVKSIVDSYDNRTICFGRIPSAVVSSRLTSSNVVIFDLGSFYFNEAMTFGDFRDYEPYSDYSIYIPFIGVVPLQAIECVNTTVAIKMIVDLIVGSATAVIYTDGVPYSYIDGQIGIDMPVTGRDMSGYAQTVLAGALSGSILGRKDTTGQMISNKMGEVGKDNINNGQYNVRQGISQLGSSGVGSPASATQFAEGLGNVGWGAGGIIAGVGSVAVAGVIGAAPIIAGATVAALMHNPSPQSAGCNVPATGLAKPLYPYFIVRHSDSWIPENYAKLYGRPCMKSGVVEDFEGFATFGNLRVDGLNGATQQEKVEIVSLLQKGVIV